MKPKIQQSSVLPFRARIENQIDLHHPLIILSNEIRWSIFGEEFAKLYSPRKGRPAKLIRMMASLLILKHVQNVSDESVWSNGQKIYIINILAESNFLLQSNHVKQVNWCIYAIGLAYQELN